MWEMETKLVLVILNGFQRRQLNIRVLGKAPGVQTPGVVTGLTMDDLLRQQPPVPAAFAHARAQPNDAERIPLAGDRPHQGCPVNRVGNRPVHHPLDPHLGQGRHPGKRPFQHVHHPVQIVRAKIIGKRWADPVHTPGLAPLFIEPHQQAVLFLPGIVIRDRAAQQRHPVACLNNCGDVFGHKILVLHGGHRMVHPHHRAHFVHPVAAGVHDDIGVDVALRRLNRPSVIRMLGKPRHCRVTVHLRTCLARVKRQRLAELRGVNIAIFAVPQPAQQVLG